MRGHGDSDAVQRVGYTAFALHLWTVFGLFLSNLTGVVALASWATLRFRFDGRRAKSILLPITLYGLCVLLSIAFSVDPAGSLRGGRELIALLGIPLALALVRGVKQTRAIVDGLIVMATFSAGWGLAQLFYGFGGIENRIRGPFSHWMTFAGVLLIADLLLISQMISGRHARSAWRWIALLAINAGIISCLTRGAWIGGALAVGVVLVIRAPRLLVVFVVALILVLAVSPVSVRERVASIGDLGDFSNYDRLCMIEAGWRMVRERPVFGQGPEMVEQRYPIYRHPTAPRQSTPHLHNNLIQIAAEEGLVAMGAHIWLMVAALWAALWRYRRSRGAEEGGPDLYLGAFGALLAFNLAGLFECNWGDTEVQRLALFMAAMPFCADRSETE